jgi:adenosylcobinamide-phosphate synthase
MRSERPFFGEGRDAGPADLARALRIYLLACAALWSMLLVGGLAWPR